MKILIVDDMSVMRKIIRKSLLGIGFENLEEAEDGNPAWEKLQDLHATAEPIEYIVADWSMPSMTGIDLLKKVRQDNRFKGIPFLLLTAEGDNSHAEAALKSGASNYLVKPFDTATFQEKFKENLLN